jgi:hypothetical protein
MVGSLQRRGLRVTVVSTIRTQPPMIADELRRQADTFLELNELAPYIAREHRPAVHVAQDQGQGQGQDDDEDEDQHDEPQDGDSDEGRFYEPA